MNFDQLDDENTKRALNDFFPRDLPPDIDVEPTQEEADAFLALVSDLQKDTDHDGGAELSAIIVGRYSVNIGTTSWKLLKALVNLAIALKAPGALNAIGAFKFAWEVIRDFADVIRPLDQWEQQVVMAIANLGGEHWRHEDQLGPTSEEIRTWFQVKKIMDPKGLPDILGKLATDNVIKETTTLEGTKHYRIEF